jgi:Fuc2NAc and GlcNAc transferase
LAYFIVDASTTLLRRALSGEQIWQAHRDHAYQHAVRSGLSHADVSGAVLSLNLFVLLPAAIACDLWREAQWPIVIISYAGLIGLVLRYDAGKRIH